MIHSKLSETKKLKNKNFCCEHTQGIEHQKDPEQVGMNNQTAMIVQMPKPLAQYNSSINYYDRYWKQFLLNQMSKYKLEQLFYTLKQIQQKTVQIEELFVQREELLFNSQNIGLQKSFRKKYKKEEPKKDRSQQNAKKFYCPFNDCFKQYGSDVSLNLHMKLKHNAGNKSERQYYAEILWASIENNKKKPSIDINFPPGYVQEYGMLTGRLSQQLYLQQKQLYNWQDDQVDKKSVCKKDQPQKLPQKVKRQQ